MSGPPRQSPITRRCLLEPRIHSHSIVPGGFEVMS
jgi:hypothetical protein